LVGACGRKTVVGRAPAADRDEFVNGRNKQRHDVDRVRVVTICATPARWSGSSADAENDARTPTQTDER